MWKTLHKQILIPKSIFKMQYGIRLVPNIQNLFSVSCWTEYYPSKEDLILQVEWEVEKMQEPFLIHRS